MNEELQIFDRQPGEGPKPFAAFVAYRQMGGSRSLSRLHVELAKSARMLKGWSSKFRWQERVAAWDADVERRQRAAEDEAIRDAARRRAKKQTAFRDHQVALGEKLIEQAEAMLGRPLERAVKREKMVVTADMVGKEIETTVVYEPTRWSKDGAARIAETGSKLVSLGLNLATDSTELTGAGGAPLVAPVGGGNTQIHIYLPEKKPLTTVVTTESPAQLEPQRKEEHV